MKPVQPAFHGSKHYANILRDRLKRIFLDMGFIQVSSPMLEISFWNFDALFVPQGHPIRDTSDTFFVKEPAKGLLPDAKLVDRVKKTHESGWTTGSTGFGYNWGAEAARTNLLRTDLTSIIARELSNIKIKELPLKIFSIDYVFRNTINNRLIQSQSVTGLMADEKINFKHLLGLLNNLFNKLGFSETRFRPSYFPYTELSVKPEFFNKSSKEWVSLGGAGILRPEVVKPLTGSEVPVLAWGLDFERILADIYNIKDLSEAYSTDINFVSSFNPFSKRL